MSEKNKEKTSVRSRIVSVILFVLAGVLIVTAVAVILIIRRCSGS